MAEVESIISGKSPEMKKFRDDLSSLNGDIFTYYDYMDSEAYPEVIQAHLGVILPKIEAFNESLNPELLISMHYMSRVINRADRDRAKEVPVKVFKRYRKAGKFALHGSFFDWGGCKEFFGDSLVKVKEDIVLINQEQGLGIDARTIFNCVNTLGAPEDYYTKKLASQKLILGDIGKGELKKMDSSWF